MYYYYYYIYILLYIYTHSIYIYTHSILTSNKLRYWALSFTTFCRSSKLLECLGEACVLLGLLGSACPWASARLRRCSREWSEILIPNFWACKNHWKMRDIVPKRKQNETPKLTRFTPKTQESNENECFAVGQTKVMLFKGFGYYSKHQKVCRHQKNRYLRFCLQC